MKKIFFTFLFAASFIYGGFCQEIQKQSNLQESKTTFILEEDSLKIEFLEGLKRGSETEEFTLDYGQIKKGSSGQRTIKFKNLQKSPLIIRDIQTTCGCTTPHWPRKPIIKNKLAEIIIEYDTQRVGKFSKMVLITFLSRGATKRKKKAYDLKIQIKGQVLEHSS